MEEVPGIPGAIPPLAPYPTEHQRLNLPPTEWQACVDLWLTSVETRLRLQEDHFSKFTFSQKASGLPFLLSYFQHHPSQTLRQTRPLEQRLHKQCYLLTKRLLLKLPVGSHLKPHDMLSFVLAANTTFLVISEWQSTLEQTAFVRSHQFQAGLATWKALVSNAFQTGDTITALNDLRRMNLLIKVLPQAGSELMQGSDYIESLISTYATSQKHASAEALPKILTVHIYQSLLSLVLYRRVSASTLIDQLFLLQSESKRLQESNPRQKTLCTSLICETGFLRHLASDPRVNDSQRGRDVVDQLMAYRENTKHLHPLPLPRRQKVSKGKGRAKASNEMHVHKAAKISHVHELFPDLPIVYVLRLLDHFHEDTEQVIAALLDPDSLPPMLQDQPVGEEIEQEINAPSDLAPRSTPPLLPQRKNVFDGDDFDKLRISSKQLHRGQKKITLDGPSTAEEHSRSKAAIMAALAVFDSDDDERDDTYDVADVGGSVDQSIDTDTRPRGERRQEQDPHEEVLFRAWKDNKELFARDSKTRVSNTRQSLKRDTSMTDEQIEGWAIMLSKDQVRQDRLHKRYSTTATFTSDQRGIAQTRWRQNTSTENSQDEAEQAEGVAPNANDGRRTGAAHIRGDRIWGTRGRGNAAVSAGNGPPSQGAQKKQDHGRQHGRGHGGRGGRHNRREGRARKMGRGFGGAPEP